MDSTAAPEADTLYSKEKNSVVPKKNLARGGESCAFLFSSPKATGHVWLLLSFKFCFRMKLSRRKFIQMGSAAGAGYWLAPTPGAAQAANKPAADPLFTEAFELLKDWGEGLLQLQVHRPGEPGLHGGILCPACAMVHGRSADIVFPLLYLCEATGDPRYSRAALSVYDWMENTVSLPDGSWVNELSASNWKGTTVFGAIALAESLQHFPHLLDAATRERWQRRLHAAMQYVFDTFTIDTGNINYPVTASYALALGGRLLNETAWQEKGKALAHEALHYFSLNDHLLYGEGHPSPVVSARGCYSIDLGYNVEESLPALVQYAQLTGDNEVLDAVFTSLQAHLSFMLPDGGWDNSWGSRNYKWTWWGSRTSDGCQPAYALMAYRDPVFYKAALLNTRLLKNCTHHHLLYGGLHNYRHGVAPCVHHTLGHSKALATLLVHQKDIRTPAQPGQLLLPMEKIQGVRQFKDIATWLFEHKGWRGTLTANDQQYNIKGGHAMGGAISLLWHPRTGPLLIAGMTRYQLVETTNMQRDKSAGNTNLTPRLELVQDGRVFSNILDPSGTVHHTTEEGVLQFVTQSRLTAEDGQPVQANNAADTRITYHISANRFSINVQYTGTGTPVFILPLVATADEKITSSSSKRLLLHKPGGIVRVEAGSPFTVTGADQRLFHFVPGMQAIVLQFTGHRIEVDLYLD